MTEVTTIESRDPVADDHRPTAWTEEQKFVLACRVLAEDGHDSVLPGLISWRAGANQFLTLPFGLGFEEARPRDLITVNADLALLRGRVKPSPAVGFLTWMHRYRPDVGCVIHTHAPYTAALAMLDDPLEVAHMDATMFHDDCAFLREWPGNPVSEVEARIISDALGKKRAVLLANHGFVTVGETIEEACYLAICFERAARMQMRARASGRLKPIDPTLAREAHDFMSMPEVMGSTFRRFARQVLRHDPDCLR
ncbi:MAG: aldolase [Stellaceae bacterium]